MLRCFILGIFIILASCNNRTKNYTNTNQTEFELFARDPIDINGFLNLSNKNVDTVLIETKELIELFDSKYVAFKKYNSRLTELSFRCCTDYLLTGVTKNGKEEYISFYSQYPDKGSELWGVIKPNLKEDSLSRILEEYKIISKNGVLNYVIENDYLLVYTISDGPNNKYLSTVTALYTGNLRVKLDSINVESIFFNYLDLLNYRNNRLIKPLL